MSVEELVESWAGGEPWAEQIAEWTAAREAALPGLNELIDRFTTGMTSLPDFAKEIDSFSKRTNLWGYRGHSGQMFLNILMRAADRGRLEDELRLAIVVPDGQTGAIDRIERFSWFVGETQARAELLDRFPPKPGYIPYFLSFFWEAKDRNWPIYYPRSRRTLVRHGLFREVGPFSQRYVAYRREILRLRDVLATTTWGVEVALFEIADEEEAPSLGAARHRGPVRASEGSARADELECAKLDADAPLVRAGLELLFDEVEATNDRIGLVRAEQVASRRDIHSYLEAISLGLDTGAAFLPRFVEVAIYTREADDAASMEATTLGLLDAFEFVLADEFPPIRSSFLRRFTARTREFTTRPEIETRLREVERAIQIQGVDLPQAKVDSLQAQAVAAVIKSLDGQRRAAIKIGSILVLKVDDELIVTTLTAAEMLRLSREPTLLNSPETLLGSLRAVGEPGVLPP